MKPEGVHAFLITVEGSLAKSEAFLAPGCFSLRDIQPAVCRGTDPRCRCEEERPAWLSPTRYGNGSRVSTCRVSDAAAAAVLACCCSAGARRCGVGSGSSPVRLCSAAGHSGERLVP